MADKLDPLAAIGMGVGALQALGSGISIPFAASKAKKAVEGISTYKVDPEVLKILEMRRARLGMGFGGAARGLAIQGIESAAAGATTAAQQMGRGAGLATIGAVQKRRGAQYQELAAKEEQLQEEQRRAYERTAGAATAERARQFASQQEKEQLRASIALEKLASARAGLSQGISGITGSAAAALYGKNV